MPNIPSIKTLQAITSYPRELRAVLACRKMSELQALIDSDKPFKRSQFSTFEATRRFQRSGYNPPAFHELKMDMADALCETCGVEVIERGTNAKSPAFEYLNAGDTYSVTLLFVNGRYRVACYGDIVERGNYA